MRKLSADYLFTLETEPIKEGVVIIDDQGLVLDVLTTRENTDNIEIFEGILCPGMINSHGHLELSHLKGKLPRDTGMVNFILSVQAFRNAGPAFVQQAMREAEEELYLQGTVAMGDISNTDSTFEMKAAGRLNYHTFLECVGFTPGNAGLVFEKAEALRRLAPGRSSLSPHAPYSVSAPLFRLLAESGQEIMSIHNQESLAENEFYQLGTGDFRRLYQTFGLDIAEFKPYGKNSLPVYAPWMGKAKTLMVHNTYTTAEDLKSLDTGHVYAFCLCPAANLYIENKLPDIPLLAGSGWPLVLGTDSLASNDRLDLLSEMHLIQQQFPEFSLETMLGWACKNAALFFNWSELGSIAVGKKPGIVQITGLQAGFRIGTESRSVRIG